MPKDNLEKIRQILEDTATQNWNMAVDACIKNAKLKQYMPDKKEFITEKEKQEIQLFGYCIDRNALEKLKR